MNKINVVSSPLPFSNLQNQTKAMPGTTLHEIVMNAVPEKYHVNGIGAIAMINGEIIPMEYWKSLKPKANTLVNIRVVPKGSGGKKNPLTTILSIAVLIAAPYAAGAILGSTLAATSIGIGTLTYGGVLASAIGVVGRLAISALSGPAVASNSGSDNISNPAESPTQYIEGAKNSLNPFGVIPINLGVNRQFPLQAARPFTETQDNDQYVRQIFTYGYSDETVIGDLRIGETDLNDFDNFEIEHKLNGDLADGTTIYSNDIYQDDLNIVLNEVDGYTSRTTQPDADEAMIDVTFPIGLTTFAQSGGRYERQVILEAQYAPTDQDPQVWSPGANDFKPFDGGDFTITPPPLTTNGRRNNSITRVDLLSIDKYTGVINYNSGTVRTSYDGIITTQAASLPANNLRIAEIHVTTTRTYAGFYGAVTTTTDYVVNDVRQPSNFGVVFETENDFEPTKIDSTTLRIANGAIAINDLDIKGNQTESLRRTVRIKFPERGQYDIRLRRITLDSTSDSVIDQSAWTALKSVRYEPPINLANQCGTAMRIKATDQLNGALDQFNVIAQNVIPDYDIDLDEWVPRITSNPASLYRYVLQSSANAKALPDEKINIDDLQEWHTHCEEQDYSYNRVIDYDTTVDAVLKDICSAGAASPAIVDGKRTVVVDKIKDTIVQMVTPRNSWGYTGEMIYPTTPHAFRVQFRNAEEGYIQDEIIVYDDGYDETNATEFEGLELQSCTNPVLAFKTARRYLASVRLQPETHTFMMDVENLNALRGDRIVLEHDVPIIGVGDGRIKNVLTSGDDPDTVTGVALDDTITIPNDSSYYMRIRLDDGTQIYKELNTTVGETSKSFDFATPFSIDDTPTEGDLCYIVEAGGELDLIITKIEPQDDLTARITAINYAPERFDAENAPIPQFDSKITSPLEFQRPLSPILLNQQSDENVMLVNSDGSFTTRAIFTLENINDGLIETKVKIRASGTTAFTNANILEASPERLIITGLEDGTRYDVHIRYRRIGTNAYSLPLQINNYLFVGASGLPDNVTGFVINEVDNVAFFKWNKNDDIDLSHYHIKYSNVFTGATWTTAQTIDDRIFETKYTIPFLAGTYLIKAVDRTGNESSNATAIITYDPGVVENAVAIITENPDFVGLKSNVISDNNALVLADPDIEFGYYYFYRTLDLSAVFPSFVSAKVVANGTFINDVFDETDLFNVDDIFGQGNNNIFDMADVLTTGDVFGIGNDAWDIKLEYRTTQTDPSYIDPINNLAVIDYTQWGDARGDTELNTDLSPMGDLTAHKFIADTQNGQHYIRHVHPNVPLDQVNTYSIFLKSSNRSARMRIRHDGTSQHYIYTDIDLSTGAITRSLDSGNATLLNVTVQEYANGWYRLILTGVIDSTGGTDAQIWIYSTLDENNLSYAGDDESYIEFWGMEVVAGTTAYEPTFSDWESLTAGTIVFHGIQFRAKLISLENNISPLVSQLSINVDMPDRIERGDDIEITDANVGSTITFTPNFKDTPAVAITIQDGDANDQIEYTNKTSGEFTFKVYNTTIGGYVTRSYDYIASGYGRKNT